MLCISMGLVWTACQEENMNVTPEEEIRNGPLFNQRYCEVLLSKLDPEEGILLEAYNTVGCNTCSEEAWNALDSDTLQEEFESPYVRLNGPRHWLLDSISSNTTTSSCDNTFGGLEMSLVATIPITIDDISTDITYTVSTVARNTVWHFYKGKQVYMLEDPSGQCFIMQSYSQKIDTNLQLTDLETLGTRLDLPPGWSYKTAILEENFALESIDGFADLVSDELENAYQFLPEGCL
ncbi:MAG: hypothetical protein AAFR66_01825 [Bacteroidota bacterium]